MIIFTYDQIGERYEFITRIKKVCDQGVERFRRVLCTVVTKNDGAVSEMFVIADRLNDGVHAVIFPIEAIHVRNRCKICTFIVGLFPGDLIFLLEVFFVWKGSNFRVFFSPMMDKVLDVIPMFFHLQGDHT